MTKTDIYIITVDGRQISTVVDAGCLYIGTTHTSLVYIDFCRVETAKVIDDRHHKFFGVISFQIETLKRLYGKTRRVRLTKRIPTKTLHLPPHL